MAFLLDQRIKNLLISFGLLALLSLQPLAAWAGPGVCLGPICGDEIQRSAKYHWQLKLRLTDQQGHRERITVDCRDGRISPASGPVERGYGSAVARRACRLADQTHT